MAPEISSTWARSAIQLYQNSGWFNTDPAGVDIPVCGCHAHGVQILGAWQERHT